MTTAPMTPAGFAVRTATSEELDVAGAATAEAYRADDLAPDHYRLVIADARTRAQHAEVLVAVDPSEEVLGSITFAMPPSPWAEIAAPGEAEFRMLGVTPAARGRGVGEALVKACIDLARERGATAVVLSSQDIMVAAHRLYARLGFDRRPALDWSPVPGVDLWGFGLQL